MLNTENTSDKETSFLDLNIKVISSDIHTSVYDKRDEFGFPFVSFPWLNGDVPRLPSYGVYISQLDRFARCCTSVLDIHSKNLKLLQNYWHIWKVLQVTLWAFILIWWNIVSRIWSEGIFHPVFYGDLVYTLKWVKSKPNFVWSGSKIVKRLRCRKWSSRERLVLYLALVHICPKAFHSD